jgi:hypothetical protein
MIRALPGKRRATQRLSKGVLRAAKCRGFPTFTLLGLALASFAMPNFLVEVYAPKAARLADLAFAARTAVELATCESGRVRYLDSMLVPEDETCFHLFEGPSAAAVSEAARRAALPFQRVVEVVKSPRRRTVHRAREAT